MPKDHTEYPDDNTLAVMGAVYGLMAQSLEDRAEADRLLRATGSWFELVRLHDVDPLAYPDRCDYEEFLRPKVLRRVEKGKLVAYRLVLADNDTIFAWDVVWGPAGVPEGRHNRMTALSTQHELHLSGPPDPEIFIRSLRALARERGLTPEG